MGKPAPVSYHPPQIHMDLHGIERRPACSEKPENISLGYGMASYSLQLKDKTKPDDVVKKYRSM